MALPNKLANPMPESADAFAESFQKSVDALLREMQASLENIERMRVETDRVRAASDSLLEQILKGIEQRIQTRKQEIAQLNAEKEILQARLLTI